MDKVYDHLLKEIEVGDEIWCEAPIEDFLTYEKSYKVIGLRPEEKRVVVIDDRGLEGWFNSDRFIKVPPT